MKMTVRNAILSHLSDSQEVGQRSTADKHVNFAKLLINKFPDIQTTVDEKELDKYWESLEQWRSKLVPRKRAETNSAPDSPCL